MGETIKQIMELTVIEIITDNLVSSLFLRILSLTADTYSLLYL